MNKSTKHNPTGCPRGYWASLLPLHLELLFRSKTQAYKAPPPEQTTQVVMLCLALGRVQMKPVSRSVSLIRDQR